MLTLGILLMLVGFSLGAAAVTYAHRDSLRARDSDITALKVGRAEHFERLRGAEKDSQANYDRAQEWRRQAIEQSRRVHELTDRLLLAAKVPTLDDDSSDPPTVADADLAAAEQERERQQVALARQVRAPSSDMEPVAVSDDEVAPVQRLTAEDAPEDEDDTSFVSRLPI